MKTRVTLRYFVNDCLWNYFLASNAPQTTLNLIYLSILLILRPFTQLQPKFTAIELQKSTKICFNW